MMKTKINVKTYCSRGALCDSEICPMDPAYDRDDVLFWWSPGESICSNPLFQELTVLKMQREIRDKAEDRDTYYNIPMLNYNWKVTKKSMGVKKMKVEETKKFFKANSAIDLKSQRELIADKERPTSIKMLVMRKDYINGIKSRKEV